MKRQLYDMQFFLLESNWYAENNNYGHSGRGSSGGGSSAAMVLIVLVICGIIGAFNEVPGALILIIVGFFILFLR